MALPKGIKGPKPNIRTCEFCNKTWKGFNLHCPHCGRKPKGMVEVGN